MNKFVINGRLDGKFQVLDLRSGEINKIFVGSWHQSCLMLEARAAVNNLEVTYTNANGTCAYAC